jgi:alkylation response protein AidB-like acyl-CoA dehydrogenase
MDRKHYEPEHIAFGEAVRAFIDKEMVPNFLEWEQIGSVPRELFQVAGQNGFLGMAVPEEYGGGGVSDFRFNQAMNEQMAYAGVTGAGLGLMLHNDTCLPYFLTYATDQQRRRWLPGIVSGELITAVAMTEPGAGSDLTGIRTSAVRDGGEYIVNGSKTFITNGDMADLVVTAVRTTPEKGAKGITLLAIEAGMDGFSRGRKLDKVGQTESGTSELFFENLEVPDANVIGEVDRGFVYMMERLAQERVGAACSNIAQARQILGETLEYVKERKAFGRPVGSFQYNKFVLAELVTKAEVTQAYVDDALVAHSNKELSAVDAAKAKWWSAQVQNEILDACVQLYGGYGYMNEYRVARAWRDARVTKIWAGSNEIMKELIGRDLGL